jgi:hypothetical protein
MPRHAFAGDVRRHLLPLPPERRQQQPFVLDARRRRIIAPWPRKRPLPGGEERVGRGARSARGGAAHGLDPRNGERVINS